MNKYDEIDAVYPPYTKETRLITGKPALPETASLDAKVSAGDKSDSAMQSYWSSINDSYDGV